jgi:hypothetical protein
VLGNNANSITAWADRSRAHSRIFFSSSYRRGRVGQIVLNLRISRCALGNSGMTDPPLRSAVHEDSKERSVGLFRGKVIFSLLQDWSRAE